MVRIGLDPLQFSTVGDLRDGTQGAFSGDPRAIASTTTAAAALAQNHQCR